MTRALPSLAEAKRLAKQLRAEHAAARPDLTHAQALEMLAHRYGFRDWNALRAAIGDRPPERWKPGCRVRGAYLSQPFVATVVGLEPVRPGWFRVSLELDEAVDVVRFESFSNLRKRIQAVVGPEGHSLERTSDGNPQLELAP